MDKARPYRVVNIEPGNMQGTWAREGFGRFELTDHSRRLTVKVEVSVWCLQIVVHEMMKVLRAEEEYVRRVRENVQKAVAEISKEVNA